MAEMAGEDVFDMLEDDLSGAQDALQAFEIDVENARFVRNVMVRNLLLVGARVSDVAAWLGVSRAAVVKMRYAAERPPGPASTARLRRQVELIRRLDARVARRDTREV
jgi:hypothetical protein